VRRGGADPDAWCLSIHLPYHVIDDVRVRMLRTEHNDLRIFVHFHVVTRWPIEQVVRRHRLLHACRIGRRQAALEDKSPMRTLAKIAIQPLKQRRRVDTGRQGEVLSADMVVSAGTAEIRPLADHGTRNLKLYIDVIFGNAHVLPPLDRLV